MRGVTAFIVVACAIASGVTAIPKRHHHKVGAAAGGAAAGGGAAAVAGAGASASAGAGASASTEAAASTGGAASAGTAASGTVTRGPQTEVLFEVNGVPGNQCLTFRNNGEIVDAACVDNSADRQITPSTLGTQQVLLVQRSFTADFRPDLVGVDACVGFNGTDYKAEPCGAAGITSVTFVGGELHAGASCASGHDGLAQLTVDTTGKTCATYTVTDVAAAAP